MNKNKILSGGGKNLTGGGKWGRRGREVGERGREVGEEGEGSGVKGGGKWGLGTPLSTPSTWCKAQLKIFQRPGWELIPGLPRKRPML